MKVSDIMTKNVVTVEPNMKIVDVASLLRKHDFNGVPVVRDGKIEGMITESDLLSQGSVSFHIPSVINLLNEMDFKKYSGNFTKDDFDSILKTDAESIMNREYISISPNAEMTELIDLFQEKHVNPIPVVDSGKNILGIISLSDIINFISRFREAEIDFLKMGQ